MSYHEVLAAREVKSPFSERFIQFLQAGLSWDVVEAVTYNVAAYQQNSGELRTNRVVPPRREGESGEQFQLRRDIIDQNASDEKMLRKLSAYREENSLDMDDTEQGWYDYIATGAGAQSLGLGDAMEAEEA